MFKKILNIVLIIIEFIFLIAGVIYPINILPIVLRRLSLFAPFSYIFEILRGTSLNDKFILINGSINILYFILVIIFYKKILKEMKKNGNLSTY